MFVAPTARNPWRPFGNTRKNGELARELHIVPLISIADQMVVAASEPVDGDQWMAILEATGMDVRFVLAEPNEIEAALDVYYPRAA